MGGWVDLGMVRYISLLLFIGLGLGQDKTIAVIDLENNGLKDSEVRILTDRLQSELVKVGGYTIVERKKIEKIFEEQKFQMSGCVQECLIKIGMLLGAKEIVIGSVGRFGSTYTVSARLVNASTGEMIRSSDFDSDRDINSLLKIGMSMIASELTGKSLEVDYESNKKPYIINDSLKPENVEMENISKQIYSTPVPEKRKSNPKYKSLFNNLYFEFFDFSLLPFASNLSGFRLSYRYLQFQRQYLALGGYESRANSLGIQKTISDVLSLNIWYCRIIDFNITQSDTLWTQNLVEYSEWFSRDDYKLPDYSEIVIQFDTKKFLSFGFRAELGYRLLLSGFTGGESGIIVLNDHNIEVDNLYNGPFVSLSIVSLAF